ncbi:MAG: UDP-N-acetylglucosamine--N-acetylmuramyl-(pentapeptide) pyrophosphoryl-undecaprenol N-acetylglucosamine transferase [Chloroflexi bacterium]|nr:UDP-N-acetylglucosamine--N-acetylmuramyl-(pentapeptide) pyrophosphoryl-undecaprenol N-acetylglucosamine transferase [Chloroflexota bacterium]
MRILIGAGGTGGHIYPALATAQTLLRAEAEPHELHFVGAVGGMESKLVAAAGLDFAGYHEVLAGPIHGVNPLRIGISLLKLAAGMGQSLVSLRRIQPHVILLTGGWANFPVALAANLLRIPIVIYLPDIEPGLTIKVLQRFARRVAVTAAPSLRFFADGKAVVTGYPLQSDRLCADRDVARAHFNLNPDRKTLLVFGGSRGARSINMALGDSLGRLLAAGLQIIHITGELDWTRAQQQLGDLAGHPHYHAFAYLHAEMGLAFAAADLAICRAGASTLAELPAFALPAILAPYPYAWRYQKVNADYLSQRGAAMRLDDEDMPAELGDMVLALLNDEARMADLRAKSRALANRDGANNVAKLLLETGRD